MSLRDVVLQAARADAIPAGSRGLWVVRKLDLRGAPNGKWFQWEGHVKRLEPRIHTSLFCYTTDTLYNGGTMVMNDCEDELQTHLNFMLRARGTVLITGLGLGCCLRGCLANPEVKHVTVIEKSTDVIRLVWPHIQQKDRISLIRADARDWVRNSNRRFDVAYHDLWDNPDHDDPHLQLMHSELLAGMFCRAKVQGAWAFPHQQKKAWDRVCLAHGREPML